MVYANDLEIGMLVCVPFRDGMHRGLAFLKDDPIVEVLEICRSPLDLAIGLRGCEGLVEIGRGGNWWWILASDIAYIVEDASEEYVSASDSDILDLLLS